MKKFIIIILVLCAMLCGYLMGEHHAIKSARFEGYNADGSYTISFDAGDLKREYYLYN